jgi:hypothetical protein
MSFQYIQFTIRRDFQCAYVTTVVLHETRDRHINNDVLRSQRYVISRNCYGICPITIRLALYCLLIHS